LFKDILRINSKPGRCIPQKGNPALLVSQPEVNDAFHSAGIQSGSVLMIHSSLSSMGRVERGADGFVDYCMDYLGPAGTLCVPAFWWVPTDPPMRVIDFDVHYSPCFNGAISEAVRRRRETYRSNNPSHSVCAIGKQAEEITKTHGTYGFRPGPYGWNAFAADSPWERLYQMNAWYGFIGVDMGCNTMAHYAEHLLFEEILEQANAEDKEILINNVSATFYPFPGWWPYFSFEDMGKQLELEGLVKKSTIGSADFLAIRSQDMVDSILRLVKANPGGWFLKPHAAPFLKWL